MIKKTEKRLELLNIETSKILEELSLIDPPFLQKNGKGWSIIQVLSHLNAAESLSLIYMKKKIQAGKKMKRVNAMNKFRMWVTGELLKTALRWRAPRYISNPKGDYSLQEMKSKWNDTRTDIKDFVSQYPEELLDRAVYKHPMGGRLSIDQAIDSFIYHQRHHVHQIRRIRKELGI